MKKHTAITTAYENHSSKVSKFEIRVSDFILTQKYIDFDFQNIEKSMFLFN